MDILCTSHCIVNSSASLRCILMMAFSLADANETALTFLQWHLMWLVCNSMWRDGSCDFGLCQCSRCPVESPAQLPPDPTWHLPYVPSLPPSVTVLPHWPPALYLWSTAWKGQTSRGKIHVRGGGGGAQACSSTLHVAIYIYLKASLRWAHIEYRNGRLSAIRSRQYNTRVHYSITWQ